METTTIPTIGQSPAFYGYITGLGIAQNYEPGVTHPYMYATFEYGNETRVWIVPDVELFEILAECLCSMAESRAMDDFGYEKLWIEMKDGEWTAIMP